MAPRVANESRYGDDRGSFIDSSYALNLHMHPVYRGLKTQCFSLQTDITIELLDGSAVININICAYIYVCKSQIIFITFSKSKVFAGMPV